MARYFNGPGQYAVGLGGAAPTLLSASQSFTLCLWVRPDTLTPSTDKHVLLAIDSGGDYWSIQYTTSGEIAFVSEGYTGSNPTTSATTAAFTDIDLSHGKRVLYRYDGTTWEVWTGSRTGGLAKKTIDASRAFALPGISGGLYLGFDAVSEFFAGAIAEIGAWSVPVSDYDAEQLLRGVACDQVAAASLVAYWPLRGTRSPEPDYVALPAIGGPAALTIASATAEAHPPVTGLDDIGAPEAAWCLELQHGDGTIYAASADLAQPVDVDVLGRAYPGRIANAESIFVSRSINDGIVSPGSTTVILQNTTALSPADTAAGGLACWLEADQIRDADDGDTVTLWPDVSGRGLDAAQSSSSGPTYDADGANGLPALLFDAGAEALDLPTRAPTDGSAPYTIVVAFSRADAAASSHTVVCNNGGGWIMYTDSSNVLKVDMGSTLTLGAISGVGETQVGSYVYTGGDAYGRINQKPWALGTPSAHPGYDPRFGANSGFGIDLDGRIAAVLIYDRALAEDELRRVENYLAAKYACTAIDHGAVLPRREWRGARAILRRYERTSHELVTELVGKVDVPDWTRYGRVALTITGAGSDVLDTRIPKAVVNVDEHESATDLLAPIPMLFGSGWVSAPYIGHDESTSPGTADFAVCHAEDADGSARNISVTRVLFDIVPSFPGLEQADSWYEAGGTTPTRVSDTVMQLSADYSLFYESGMPVRVTIAGTLYYTTVVSYDTGTDRVTVADAVVTNNPTKVEILAGGYLVQTGEYTSGGADLKSVRFVGTGFGGGVVVEASGSDLTNPAEVIEEILRNDVAGLGQSVDSALFAQALADFSTAGLDQACQFALGGDRQQRSARAVLSEILSLRGAWLDQQPDGTWGIYVDKLPAWDQLRAYGVGSPRFAPIERVTSHTFTPLGQLVGALKLRYRKKGRSRSNDGVTSWAAPSDYEFQNNYTVSTTGADRVITNPWLDRATIAGKVVVYQGKRLKYEDERLSFVLGFRGRNVALGEIVRLCLPASQVDGDYRVVSLNRGLRQTTLGTVGYSPEIFEFDAGEVEYDAASGTNTSADTSDTATGPGKPIMGPNLIPNSGFAATSGSFSPIAGGSGTDTTYLGGNSGWTIAESETSVTDIAAVSVTDSDAWIGGRYLSIQIDSTTGDPHIRSRVTVEPLTPHLAAVYLGKSGVSDPSDVRGWHPVIRYYTALGSQTGSDYEPKVRATGELTGDQTARRWYFGFTPPSAARYAILFLYFDDTGTYRVAAASINQSDRFAFLPPPWQNTALRS